MLVSARLVPPIRDLFSAHPLAVRCSPEQVAALLWVLRHVPEPVGNFEVEAALEVLDVEREREAA
jgi:hypothetical protein